MILLCALLVLASMQAARLGVSGLIVELARYEVDAWTASGKPQSIAAYTRVAGYYADSLDIVADNPWALEGLGALDLARVRLSRVPQEALGFARDARMRFREALRQRPATPFLWANLALAKLYLDEIDAEFLAAIRHADELGPWEPRSQQVVLFVSLAAWDKLDAAGKRAVVRVLERGGVHNPTKMFEIVKSYQRFDLVCRLSSYDAVAGAECRKAALGPGAEAPKSKGRR
jgi:hypothetical protein